MKEYLGCSLQNLKALEKLNLAVPQKLQIFRKVTIGVVGGEDEGKGGVEERGEDSQI